ncbi:transglutaminase domain-containing protein [Paenibacillus sp. SYP-B3998]|uniref:Transglutaminase domain-containing protein n=1 Tax=Paenibacillus sp. SYP-B3998 TaxID=2678564 RepID=A0A6G4A0W0_9BACL|nr:transglutaminase domain-containing protein [Paenibacillus sp. SYP-B3998]NEW08103.1 transglutaminase domain-containing protein [Paenibacillus sp. SYP-B3998]
MRQPEPSRHQIAASGESQAYPNKQFRAGITSQVPEPSRQASATRSRTNDFRSEVRSGDSMFRDVLISILLFFLLIEWLRPLPAMADVSEVYRIQPFLVVFALSIAIDCFKVPYIWGWVAKSMIILFFIGFMFDRNAFLSGSWVIDFIRLISQDAGHVLQAKFDNISGETRTLLFLFGWSLLISVVQALMLQRQHSLWFVGATLAYLVCLQLVLGTDTVYGIIRTLCYGLLLASILNLSRIQQFYGFANIRPAGAFQWLLAAITVVGVMAGAGWYSAIQAAPTPLMKPVSWAYLTDRMFELYNEDAGLQTSAARSGYGHDDSLLGGPLQSDNTLVFTAKTSKLTYWRGESKSFYNGKGWTQTEQTGQSFVPRDSLASAPTITQEVLWSPESSTKQLFYGGALLRVDAILTEKGKSLSPEIVIRNNGNDKVSVPEISDPLSFYKITIQSVFEDPAALGADSSSYPISVRDTYLQLPANLPRTVRALAQQVTTNYPNPYAKAVAIEQYLRSSYSYSLDKPTRPTRNEDFVSHFLFVDRVGYCDHFSTSMVVLLRSVGVPARWVKGYAPGTLLATTEDHLQEVRVSNQDAHSWVEVYFPSTGWVPFEPTPGFSSLDSEQARAAFQNAQAERPTMTASLAMTSTRKSLATDPMEWLQMIKNEFINFVQTYRKHLLIIAALTILLTGLFLAFRGKIKLLFLSYDVRLSGSRPEVRHMDRLWLQMFHKYGAKSAHQTVREYVMALQIKNMAQKEALLEFALMYESIRYDTPGRPAYSKRDIAAVWGAIQSIQGSQK